MYDKLSVLLKNVAISKPDQKSLATAASNFPDLKDLSRAVYGSKENGEKVLWLTGQRRSKDVCVFLNAILDNSGSMNAVCGNGKTRLEVALECLSGVVRSEDLNLCAPDSLVVHTFNNDVIIRLCCHPDRYDHGKLVNNINNKFGDTSQTRMRDAIFDALDNMEKHPEDSRQGKEVVRYLLVLTDGADTRSSRSTDELLARLNQAADRLKNLHLVIIAAGLEPSALEPIGRLCNSRVPVKVHKVETVTDVNIKAAFDKAMDYLRVLLYRGVNGSVSLTQYAGRDKQKVAKMDQGAVALFNTCTQVKVLTTQEIAQTLQLEMGGAVLMLPPSSKNPFSRFARK